MPTIRIDNIKEWPPERFEAALREAMEKQSPIDDLLDLAARLMALEKKYSMKSSEFHERFERGEMGDDKDFIWWAGLYDLFRDLKTRVEKALFGAAVAWEIAWQSEKIEPLEKESVAA